MRPQDRVRLRLRLRGVDDPLVVARPNANEYAGRRVLQRLGNDARILQCLPRTFEQQAMLRIDVACLSWADAEKASVEGIYLLQERRPANVALALSFRVGVIVRGRVPALRWHDAHRVLSTRQELP